VSGIVRRSFLGVGTSSSMSIYCRDVFGEVGFYRDEFGDFGLVSRRLRPGRLLSGHIGRRHVSVGTFSASSG